MPKFLRACPPQDDSEGRKIRQLAGARHAPADWIERGPLIPWSAPQVSGPSIQLHRPFGARA